MEKKRLLLGAHLSGAGGLYNAITIAESLGCNALQLFTKNNRQWNTKPLTVADIDQFKYAVDQSSIDPLHIFVHAIYLINIGSANPDVEQKSIAALSDEIRRCSALQIPYVVLHPGSHVGGTDQSCLERIVINLDSILSSTPQDVTILLETMAGQGSSVGHRFEQLAFIINKLPQHANRLGVCLDTCHIFVAGYDFTSPEQYKHVFETFDSIIGLGYLKLIHLNDSKTGCNSHVDRHAHIGKGMIGLESFNRLINDPKLSQVPKILETPYTTLEEITQNMVTVQALVKNSE